MDPDQTAALGAVWSGFISFASIKKILFASMKKCSLKGTWIYAGDKKFMHIIIIVTWSGVLYHVEWMRFYHRITGDVKHRAWSNGMASFRRSDTDARSSYFYNNMFIIYLFLTLFWFYNLFWSLIATNHWVLPREAGQHESWLLYD